MAENPGTDLSVLVTNATELVASDASISMKDLLKALSPKQESAPVPARLPAPRKITEPQRAAIKRMPEVFGEVIPAERRMLTPGEIEILLVERTTLDEVKKVAEARLKDITITAHNHLDVQIENQPEELRQHLLTDTNGNYIAEGRIGTEDTSVEFSREVRESSASLPLSALEALEQSGDIDHKTFLAMTSQTRYVDEAKVMALVKKNPALIAALAKATEPGSKGTSMYVRAKK